MTDLKEQLEIQIEKLSPKEGDILILRMNSSKFGLMDLENILRNVKQMQPQFTVVILPSGVDLERVSKSDARRLLEEIASD
jgi:MinD superfamily P-loop ATPase